MSDQSSPTDKSKPNLEAVYQDTPQHVNSDVYREVEWQVYQVDQDSAEATCRERNYKRQDGHRSGLPTTITASSSIYQSTLSTDDYLLQHTQCVRKHCRELIQR